MSFETIPIFGYDNGGGLQRNKKPFLLRDQAFQRLENAYVYRESVRKRRGIELVGRLQRIVTGASLGNTGAGVTSIDFPNIFATLGLTTNESPQMKPGSLTVTLGAPDTATFTDDGDGSFTTTGAGTSVDSFINYVNGNLHISFSAPTTGGAVITVSFRYYPTLPVMGITNREIAGINFEQTIFFDTKYAYIYNGTEFQEYIPASPAVTWQGTDSDFFWTTNYRGINAFDRLFFATNFVNDANNPMRYSDNTTWTTFAPLISATDTLFQARILIPYYGRLLALNTWEGTTGGSYAGASNYFNRCRFSQIGNPVAVDAWRSDQFGKGGFLDAPTNEQIVSAVFINNTLIVFFERTTWQLRYVGEYGLPFIWERISSDLGSESTFSPILFSNNVLAVGDKAIIAADANGVSRIDLDIPDQIFDFQNANDGVLRVQGVRDYQRELVFWCYPDSQTQSVPGTAITYPNKVLVYNYRNQEWSIFRDNVTAFGTLQFSNSTNWDDTTVTWDDMDEYWDEVDNQSRFPFIVSGNQNGYIHKYGTIFPDQPSLTVTGVSFSGTILNLTIPNHNLSIGESINLTGLNFIELAAPHAPLSTDLNNKIYYVAAVPNSNTISLAKWDFSLQQYVTGFTLTPPLGSSLYVGGGQVTIYPKPVLQTKDFNPYLGKGYQTKLSYIDFLMDSSPTSTAGTITGASQANPCVITSAGHGLQSGQKIIIYGVGGMTQLNVGQFYTVTVINTNSFSIGINSTNFTSYTSGGSWLLITSNVAIQLLINSSTSISGNLLVGNNQLSTASNSPFYPTTSIPAQGAISSYAWYRFYATTYGQFFNLTLTYDDNMMNTSFTHTLDLVLNGITMFARPGGKSPF